MHRSEESGKASVLRSSCVGHARRGRGRARDGFVGIFGKRTKACHFKIGRVVVACPVTCSSRVTIFSGTEQWLRCCNSPLSCKVDRQWLSALHMIPLRSAPSLHPSTFEYASSLPVYGNKRANQTTKEQARQTPVPKTFPHVLPSSPC